MDNQHSTATNDAKKETITLDGHLFNFLIFSVIFLLPLLSVVILYRAVN